MESPNKIKPHQQEKWLQPNSSLAFIEASHRILLRLYRRRMVSFRYFRWRQKYAEDLAKNQYKDILLEKICIEFFCCMVDSRGVSSKCFHRKWAKEQYWEKTSNNPRRVWSNSKRSQSTLIHYRFLHNILCNHICAHRPFFSPVCDLNI